MSAKDKKKTVKIPEWITIKTDLRQRDLEAWEKSIDGIDWADLPAMVGNRVYVEKSVESKLITLKNDHDICDLYGYEIAAVIDAVLAQKRKSLDPN